MNAPSTPAGITLQDMWAYCHGRAEAIADVQDASLCDGSITLRAEYKAREHRTLLAIGRLIDLCIIDLVISERLKTLHKQKHRNRGPDSSTSVASHGDG